jgi:hypothetical protein
MAASTCPSCGMASKGTCSICANQGAGKGGPKGGK